LKIGFRFGEKVSGEFCRHFFFGEKAPGEFCWRFFFGEKAPGEFCWRFFFGEKMRNGVKQVRRTGIQRLYDTPF